MKKYVSYISVAIISIILILSALVILYNEPRSLRSTNNGPCEIEWIQTFGTKAKDDMFVQLDSILKTSDGGYILAGYTEYHSYGSADMWLVKTNATGQIEWSNTYGGIEWDHAYSVLNTTDGGYVLVGSTRSYGAGDDDIWLVKTNSIGQMEWNHTYGGNSSDLGYSIIAAPEGGYLIVGETGAPWIIKTNIVGEVEWNRTIKAKISASLYSATVVPGGGYAFSGINSSDMWLLKTDGDGIEEWNHTYGGKKYDNAFHVIATPDEGYLLAGVTQISYEGDNDIYLVKTNATGQVEWNQTYGGTAYENLGSIIQTSDGGFILGGKTASFSKSYSDAWLVKTNATGQMEWNQTFGGVQDTHSVTSIVETSTGGFVFSVVGETLSKSYSTQLVKVNLIN